MSIQKSNINLPSHSEAKVKLFGSYIQKYLNIICNDKYTESIHIFDLFCGPGIYDNDKEGSPVIALRKIKQTFDQSIGKPPSKLPKIHCYFNDIDQRNTKILENHIKKKKLHYNDFGSINLSSLSYEELINQLPSKFKAFKNEKAFIFIDPFGYKDIKAENILNLLNCNKKSEVLLWLPVQFMYRFSKKGTPSVLKSFNSQLSINQEEIQSEWDYIDALKNGFEHFIGNSYYVDKFTLKKKEGTVFCLFFFSSHIRGYEKMLETKWEIDNEQGRGWKYNSSKGATLFPDLENNKLETFLISFLQKEKRTNGEIFEFILRRGFLSKHSNQVLKNLQDNNRLELYRQDGLKVRKSAFYLNYEAYKDEFDKLTIKLR